MIETYKDLKERLALLTDEQLAQPIDIMFSNPDGDKTNPLHSVFEFGTVEYFCRADDGSTDLTRSSDDNQHHPERFVLLADYNPYAEDGSIGEDLITGERIYPKNMKAVTDDSTRKFESK